MRLAAKKKSGGIKNALGYIYSGMKKRGCIPISKQVQKDLIRLHPSSDKEQMYCNYFVDKVLRSFLVVGITLILAIILKVQSYQNSMFEEIPFIQRNPYMGEDKQIELIADIGGIEEQLTVCVGAEQLTEKEVHVLHEEFLRELPQLIIGENLSLQEVTSQLVLEESYEGYPFLLEWESDNKEVISRNGTVCPMETKCRITLSVDIFYEEQIGNGQIEVIVLPYEKTKEESDAEELVKMLEVSEKGSEEESIWTLPTNWLGQDIYWKKKVEDYSLLVLGIGMFVAVLIFFCNDMDLHKEVAERGMQIRQDYPDVVYKILLYMGAGMTMRGAFRKIAEEYEEKRTSAPRAAYEEILYTVHELESGISEHEAYVNLGKRTGVQEFIRLGSLLAQNLKRGNSTLLLRLQEEVNRASVERMQNAKKCAEEAVTKLLVPMVMMLAIVMIMVMMPAFTSIK